MDEAARLIWSERLSAGVAAEIAARIARERWFGSKSRQITGLRLVAVLPLSDVFCIAVAQVDFAEGASERYQLPLAIADEAQRASIAAAGGTVWTEPNAGSLHGWLLYDAASNLAFADLLLGLFDGQAQVAVPGGTLVASQTEDYAALRGDPGEQLPARPLVAEQSNSSIAYGERLILKLYRRVESGANPDLEVNQYLSERGFAHVAATAGALEFQPDGQPAWPLGMVSRYVPNQGDAWQATCGQLEAFLRQSLTNGDIANLSVPNDGICSLAEQPIPDDVRATFKPFLVAAEILGERTGELHVALAGESDDPAFMPRRPTAGDARDFAERGQALTQDTLRALRARLPELKGNAAELATAVLAREAAFDERWQALATAKDEVLRMRVHGDYHLGQVLVAGSDYYLIDFEGEPATPLNERREKQLALRDVAGMVRSYHYASCTALNRVLAEKPNAAHQHLRDVAHAWYTWNSVAFLSAYRRAVGPAPILPDSDDAFRDLFDACLLMKAVYELRYELNNRPDWVAIPLGALAGLARL